MRKVTINFYDEEFKMELAKSLSEFRVQLSRKLNMSMSDINELIIYYQNNLNQKIFVTTEQDYSILYKSYIHLGKVFIEVSESSKLFIQEIEKAKEVVEEVVVVKEEPKAPAEEAPKKRADSFIILNEDNSSESALNQKKLEEEQGKYKATIETLELEKALLMKKCENLESLAESNKGEKAELVKNLEAVKEKLATFEVSMKIKNENLDKLEQSLEVLERENTLLNEQMLKNEAESSAIEEKYAQELEKLNLVNKELEQLNKKLEADLAKQVERSNELFLISNEFRDKNDKLIKEREFLMTQINELTFDVEAKIKENLELSETNKYLLEEIKKKEQLGEVNKEPKNEEIYENVKALVDFEVEKALKQLKGKIIEEVRADLEFNNNNKQPQVLPHFAAVHYGVTCDSCRINPVRGNRYKCEGCPNFDLCENCHNLKPEAKHNHSFYIIPYPNPNPYNYFQPPVFFKPPMICNQPILKPMPVNKPESMPKPEPLNVNQGKPKPFMNFFRPLVKPEQTIPKNKWENTAEFARLKTVLANEFGVTDTADAKVLEALDKTNGNVEKAIEYFFNF